MQIHMDMRISVRVSTETLLHYTCAFYLVTVSGIGTLGEKKLGRSQRNALISLGARHF